MINNYLIKKIIWTQDSQNEMIFRAMVDGNECILKINDFPSEPMYTLTVSDGNINFDDKPELWEFNYNF